MTFKLEITINGSHPTETIATLGDLVYFIDDMAALFSSKEYVGEKDVPLVITYQGEHNLDPVTSRPLPSKLILSDVNWTDMDYTFPSRPEFAVGDEVRHVFTGIPLIVKASAYYHINKTFTYLCYNPDDDLAQMYSSGQLMTEQLFSQIPTMLFNITDKEWEWNAFQGIFQCYSNRARKMRPTDAIATWKMNHRGQEVPF